MNEVDKNVVKKRGKRDKMFLKDGNWFLDYRLSNGRRKREKIGPSKKLAEKVLQKRMVAIAEGRFLDKRIKKRIRLVDFVNLFIENYCKPNKSSWKDDEIRLNILVQFLGAQIYLDDITPYHFEQFKKYKLGKKVKTSTINRYMTIAKTMFNRAIDWGNIEKNPLLKVKFFKEDNERIRYLEKEEMKTLLEASDPYLKDVLLVALNTGMRYGEIFSLKWNNINFQRNLIFIRKTKNKERRIIPMNTFLKGILLKRRESSLNEDIFPIKDMRLRFEKALKSAQISNFRFHDLRHTFASYLVMGGVDLVTVKELLGHKTIKMTLRYAHLSQSHKSYAVECLGQKLESLDTFRTLYKDAKNTEYPVLT